MPERPLKMSPDKNRLITNLKLAVIALAATMAGCETMSNLNPFDDDEDDMPPPVASSSSSSTVYSASSTGTSAPPAQQQSRMVLVEQAVPLAAGAPDEYIWPEVWYVNPQVENPHLIYPGDVLALVTIDGQQRITTVRGSTYRVSPTARATPLTEAVTSIPYEQIASFLSKGMVLEKEQADQLPYILATRGDHMMASAGNEIYVRGGQPSANGTEFSVVHVGDELRDPDDNDLLGYQGIYVGEGAQTRGGDPATVALTDTNREALEGDRLVPETVDIPLNFFPKAPDSNVDGRIISVVDGVSLIGQYQVVVLNRGARNGLAPGDILTVFQAGDTVRDRYAGRSFNSTGSGFMGGESVTLPDEAAGTVMIFKVYDRIGYALVMEATSDIHVLDAVRNPI
jgi:hypothetical protein